MTETQIDVLIALGAVFTATICWAIVAFVLEVLRIMRADQEQDAITTAALRRYYGLPEYRPKKGKEE